LQENYYSDTNMVNYPLTKLVGQRLRALRIKNGITEPEICELLQMRAGDFAEIEEGMTAFPLWRLKQIAQFFNVDIHDLVKRREYNHVSQMEEVAFLTKTNPQQAEEILRMQRRVIELYNNGLKGVNPTL
jgi:transcriptional regulator with XRE-family HTH domain